MKKENFISMSELYLDAHNRVTEDNKIKKEISEQLKPAILEKGEKSSDGSYSISMGGVKSQMIFKPKYNLVESVLKKVCKIRGIKKRDVTTVTEFFDPAKVEQLHTDGIITEEDMKEIFEELPNYSIRIQREKSTK